jgi:microtubule-associated protein tau
MERPSSSAGVLEEEHQPSAGVLEDKHQPRLPDGDADSGVDETTQGKDPETAARKGSRIPKKTPPESPLKRSRELKPLDIRRMPRSKSVPKAPFNTYSTPPSSSDSIKKVPMNKIVVGATPSPNLKAVRSKVGSMTNTNYRPGGGDVKIESRKLDWRTTARTNNLNDGYTPGGGDKKIESKKLSWTAGSKVGSLDKVTHKPGGGTRKIESRKLDWNTESKVGSKDNMKHKPGGGNIQIHSEKVKFETGSRIGSLKNMKHKPGGGQKKIFDDKDYMRQVSEGNSGPASLNGSVAGSSSQLSEYSERKSSIKQNKAPRPDFNYSSQIIRKLSPMSSGF